MKDFFKILFIIFTTASLSSCDKNRIFEANKDFENQSWAYKDTVNFEVDIKQVKKVNTYLNIRHSFYYGWRNIWLEMKVLHKDSIIYQSQVNMQLSQPSGEWFGECSGDICFYRYPLEEFSAYEFPDTGLYTFQIVQDMRENPLENMLSLGLRIELFEQIE